MSYVGTTREDTGRCAFLTLTDPTGFVIDDELAHGPLAERGWGVEAVPWSRPGVDWAAFDAVVIRSTWDYQQDPAAFLGVLESIESAGVRLLNPLDMVRWNLEKTYLEELAVAGVPTVPTVVLPRLEPGEAARLFDRLGAEEVVVKPVVGANAQGAFRLVGSSPASALRAAEAHFRATPLLAQPFVASVVDEGEHSLFFFDGAFSHAILKSPAAGDYRVQEEHGARIRPVEAEPALRAVAELALRAVPGRPLYARVDLVRSPNADVHWIMEVELIEPSLYLRTDRGAPARFADAFVRVLEERASSGARRG